METQADGDFPLSNSINYIIVWPYCRIFLGFKYHWKANNVQPLFNCRTCIVRRYQLFLCVFTRGLWETMKCCNTAVCLHKFSHYDFKIALTREETVYCLELAHTKRLKYRLILSCHLITKLNLFLFFFVFKKHHSGDDDWQS